MKSYAFETEAARDSAVRHPGIGDTCFITETGETRVWLGNVYGWTPPWTTAWGEVAYVESFSVYTLTNEQLPALEPVPGLVLTLRFLPARKYEIRFDGGVAGPSTDRIDVRFTDEPFTFLHAQRTVPITMPNVAPSAVTLVKRIAPSVADVMAQRGDITVQVSAGHVTRAGGFAGIGGDGNYGASLQVRDIGPSGNPRYA